MAFNIEETSYRTKTTFAQGKANYFQGGKPPARTACPGCGMQCTARVISSDPLTSAGLETGAMLEARKDRSYFRLVRNSPIRRVPSSMFCLVTGYEMRMCSPVPKASPGTVTTWASWSRRVANSVAVLTPPLPR